MPEIGCGGRFRGRTAGTPVEWCYMPFNMVQNDKYDRLPDKTGIPNTAASQQRQELRAILRLWLILKQKHYHYTFTAYGNVF